MSHYQVDELVQRLETENIDHFEVFERGPVRAEVGRYVSGSDAAANTHAEDEIYWVVSGSGSIEVGTETHQVEPGDVVYVERGTEHGFVDVAEELTVFVLFVGESGSASYADG